MCCQISSIVLEFSENKSFEIFGNCCLFIAFVTSKFKICNFVSLENFFSWPFYKPGIMKSALTKSWTSLSFTGRWSFEWQNNFPFSCCLNFFYFLLFFFCLNIFQAHLVPAEPPPPSRWAQKLPADLESVLCTLAILAFSKSKPDCLIPASVVSRCFYVKIQFLKPDVNILENMAPLNHRPQPTSSTPDASRPHHTGFCLPVSLIPSTLLAHKAVHLWSLLLPSSLLAHSFFTCSSPMHQSEPSSSLLQDGRDALRLALASRFIQEVIPDETVRDWGPQGRERSQRRCDVGGHSSLSLIPWGDLGM